MKKIAVILTTFLASFCLISCSQMTKQDVGTVSGGVLGGLVGSQFGKGSGQLLAIGAGTLLGAYMGGAIGKNMDDTDKMKVNQALENNQVNQPSYWKNTQTDNAYTVVPVKNVTMDGNPYCREYRTTAVIAGKRQQMYGTACRQPDGTWQMMSSQ